MSLDVSKEVVYTILPQGASKLPNPMIHAQKKNLTQEEILSLGPPLAHLFGVIDY